MLEHIRATATAARINLREIQEQQDERELREAAIYATCSRQRFAFAARQEIIKFKGNSGSIECPKCKNILIWVKASNRHISAICRTKNCICFME